jgi:hypothetical protein
MLKEKHKIDTSNERANWNHTKFIQKICKKYGGNVRNIAEKYEILRKTTKYGGKVGNQGTT